MSVLNQIADLFRGKMTTFPDYEEAARQAQRLMGTTVNPSRPLEYALRDNFNHGYRLSLPPDVELPDGSALSVEFVNHTNWWWQREAVRQYAGVYPHPTDALLRTVSTLHLEAYAVHMSTDPDTPEAVCYTPDNAMGQADRQVKLSSLSKLITKLFPLASDEYKQQMDAAHKAELDPTIHFATTREEIQYVYQNMDGDTGCMRYDNAQWGLPPGYHPSNVYAAPGVAVAYHKVGDTIKARALTWVNQATGEKQYVRVYGDRALKRKLDRAGYVYGSMAGAKIKAVPMPEGRYGEHMYLVPYIDGGLGNANSDGIYGYIDQREPEYIQLVSDTRRHRLQAAGVDVRSFRDHRNVVHPLQPQDLGQVYFTCPLTGVDVDKTADKTLTIWRNGKAETVLSTTDARQRWNRQLYRLVDSKWQRLYHLDNTPNFYHSSMGYTVDTVEHRESLGYVRLCKQFYPLTEWAWEPQCLSTTNGHILRTDTARIVEADGRLRNIHRTEVKALVTRKSPYVSIGVIDGMAHYAHKDNPKLHVLRSGKRALEGYNEIVELFDGTWTAKRNAVSMRFYGEAVNWLKGQYLPVDTTMVERALRRVLGNAFDFDLFCETIVLRYGQDQAAATKSLRNTLAARATEGVICRAAGVLPRFNNEGVYTHHQSGLYPADMAEVRTYAGLLKAADPEAMGPVVAAHAALHAAVLTELLALYDGAETMVAHAARRLRGEAEPAPEPQDLDTFLNELMVSL